MAQAINKYYDEAVLAEAQARMIAALGVRGKSVAGAQRSSPSSVDSSSTTVDSSGESTVDEGREQATAHTMDQLGQVLGTGLDIAGLLSGIVSGNPVGTVTNALDLYGRATGAEYGTLTELGMGLADLVGLDTSTGPLATSGPIGNLANAVTDALGVTQSQPTMTADQLAQAAKGEDVTSWGWDSDQMSAAIAAAEAALGVNQANAAAPDTVTSGPEATPGGWSDTNDTTSTTDDNSESESYGDAGNDGSSW